MRRVETRSVPAPLAGAVGGAAAAAPMAAYMLAVRKLTPSTRWQRLPPRQIVARLARRTGVARKLPWRERDAVTRAAHFGYGGAAGSLYPYASRVLPGPTVVKGALFGVGLWGASYLGWLPAAGILRPATREPAGRNLMMISAHVLWGVGTALVSERLLRRGRQDGVGNPGDSDASDASESGEARGHA